MRYLHYTLLMCLTLVTSIKAQNSGVAFELHYPLAFADTYNFTNEIYGIIGGSVALQLSDNTDFNYGLKYKFDQLIYNTLYNNSKTVNRNNFMIHHVNGFGTFSLNQSETIKLGLEGGLTFYKYRKSNYQPSYFGFNISPGLIYEFEKQFYIFAHYSYIKAALKQKQTGYVDQEKLQVTRVGIGFRL